MEELKRYVGFTAEDEACLAALRPRVAPHFPAIADEFYKRILAHDGASRAITGGPAQVERLKGTLRAWTERMFTPPWDEAYYEQRAKIGRVHVAIGLPQQYMFSAVDVIRLQLQDIVMDSAVDRAALARELSAVNKVLDIELAVMLHTYKEDYLRQAQRNERLATFGQLVASIGHELRNPLGVIESSVYLLRSRVPQEERVVRHLDRIEEQVKLSNRIITDLLDMVRDRPADRSPNDVAALVATAIEATPRASGIEVQRDLPAGLPRVLCDGTQVGQVLGNLLQNASDAAGPGGRIRVSACVDGATVAIRVEDGGPGIDETVRARLFEPLVTTKVRGVGLGLALCRRFAERNGGSVALVPAPVLPGACFEVRLPIAET